MDIQQLRVRRLAGLIGAIIVIGLLLVGSTSGLASTLTGATGLIKVPTADTLSPGLGEFSIHYHRNQLTAAVSYGVLDHVEIGANTRVKGANPLDLGFVMKANLVSETAQSPAIALGFETGLSYLVVSKLVAPRVRGTLGYGIGRQSGPFAGVAITLNTASVQGRASMPPTTLMAEVSPGSGLDIGARILITPMLSADLVLYDMKDVAGGVFLRTHF